MAESEREYQDSWRQVSNCGDLIDDMTRTRERVKEEFCAYRQARKCRQMGIVAKSVLVSSIKDLIKDIRDMRTELDSIISDNDWDSGFEEIAKSEFPEVLEYMKSA
jgi:hypothetical protein